MSVQTTFRLFVCFLFVCFACLALSQVLGVNHTWAGELNPPNPKLKPRHGSVELKHGFTPDPFTKPVSAGGDSKTELGGVKAHVTNSPDFKLHFTAEVLAVDQLPAPLRIYVESKADTTLLVNLPDGTWVANDDGGGNKNPELRFGRPQTGWYTIWVGTFQKTPVEGVAATLHISELPPGKTEPKKK